jgi:DegT/DnrJ/EryC1/StrS aminotransferase family
VNHEFGYPYRDLADLRRYGLPIIEDACHSFLSDTDQGNLGRVGDFTVFSLPKVLSIQMGGVLAYDARYRLPSDDTPSDLTGYLRRALGHDVDHLDDIRAHRIGNHERLSDLFAELGCSPRFDRLERDVPGVFLFRVPPGTDLPRLKEHGWRHGIECSVFYGEDAFFIPVHQRLTAEDLAYFAAVFGPPLMGGAP